MLCHTICIHHGHRLPPQQNVLSHPGRCRATSKCSQRMWGARPRHTEPAHGGRRAGPAALSSAASDSCFSPCFLHLLLFHACPPHLARASGSVAKVSEEGRRFHEAVPAAAAFGLCVYVELVVFMVVHSLGELHPSCRAAAGQEGAGHTDGGRCRAGRSEAQRRLQAGHACCSTANGMHGPPTTFRSAAPAIADRSIAKPAAVWRRAGSSRSGSRRCTARADCSRATRGPALLSAVPPPPPTAVPQHCSQRFHPPTTCHMRTAPAGRSQRRQ